MREKKIEAAFSPCAALNFSVRSRADRDSAVHVESLPRDIQGGLFSGEVPSDNENIFFGGGATDAMKSVHGRRNVTVRGMRAAPALPADRHVSHETASDEN